MAQLNSLLVTGNSRFLNPINGNARNGIYYVKGTQTAATGAWTGNIPVPALYDGLTIMYYLPYNGSGNATLNLTLSDGTTTGAKNCYYSTGRLTTHYSAGQNVVMTYHPAGAISVNGTATSDDRWIVTADYNSDYVLPYTWTGGGTAEKYISGGYLYIDLGKQWFMFNLIYANTYAGALTLNVNGTGAKPLYINGAVSSSSNHTMPRGTYLTYYDGTNYYVRTDGKITASITGDAATVGGHTVAKDVPSNAVFTDNNTTYTFANGTNGFTVTPSGGSAQTVTVTPSIANNVTGSGTSGYIAKFNGGNTITNGPALGSSTTTFLRNDGQWATPAAGSDVNVTQTATSTSANYEVLFSGTADNTTRTEGARKNNNLTFNPSTGILTTKHLSALFSGSKVYSEEVSACTTDSGGNWYPTVTLNGTNGAITATTLNGTTIGSSPKFTDTNVTQTETSATVNTHEILFSETGDNVTRTEGACKSQQFRYANAMSFTWTDWAGNQHTAQYVQPVGQLYIGTDTCILGNGYIYANANITVGSVNTNKVTCNSMSVQDISTNYTPAKTSGNWSIGSDDGVYRIHAYRTGNVVQLAIILHGNGSAVSAGANGFVGSISGGALPVDQVTLTGFYSSSSIMAVLDTDGSLTVRPFQNTTLSSSSRLYMTGTFICS